VAKRYTTEQWKKVELDFYKWCKEHGAVNVYGAYNDLSKRRRYPFTYQAYRKRADGWKDLAASHAAKTEKKKVEKEVENLKTVRDDLDKSLMLSGFDVREEAPRPREAAKIINEAVAIAQKGFSNSQNIFLNMTHITRTQLERMAEIQESGNALLTVEEANATLLLVNATDKALKIFKQTATVDRDDVKALMSLEESYKQAAIEHKEEAKKKATESKDEKAKIALNERIRKHAKKNGIEV
jgi:hypothetical protein